MNIIVYARHHFPQAVMDNLEKPFEAEQLRVANVIEDGIHWWIVLYQNGHQHSIVEVDPATLTPEPVDPFMKAVA